MSEKAPQPNNEPNWNLSGGHVNDMDAFAQYQQQLFEQEVAQNELSKREINSAIDSPRKALEAAKADAPAQPSKELVVYEAPVAEAPSQELVPYTTDEQAQPAPSDAETEVIPTQVQTAEQFDEEELSPETQEGRKKLSLLTRVLIWPSIKITQAYGYMQSRSEKSLAKRNEAKEQRDGESDEDYARRIRFHKIRGSITEAAILGAATAAFALTKTHSWDDVLPFVGGGDSNSSEITAASAEQTAPGAGQDGAGSGAEVDPSLSPEMLDQMSRQGETDFLATNGRVRNDFNDISGAELQNGQGHEGLFPGYDALMDQYDKSPHMLGAQLDQMHELGVVFPDNLGELNRQPGESYDAYIERVSDAMHHNTELHDNATKFTGEWLAENKAAPQDLVGDYQSAFIVPDGNGGWRVEWDPSVASQIDGDTFQPTGTTIDENGNTVHHGIRFPCGQPIKIIEGQVYEVPVESSPGIGGGPSPEDTPETQPPVTQPPETQPPVTQPPETQPPVTQPPETQPPVTQPPETQPPVTQPPETQPPTFAPKPRDGDYGTGGASGGELTDPVGPPAATETDPSFTEPSGESDPAAVAPGSTGDREPDAPVPANEGTDESPAAPAPAGDPGRG